MRVSVAIINYNYGAYLAEAIDSVLRQTRPVDEVVVVDDGSTDDSRDVLAAYGDPVRAILTGNRGPAAASTTALSSCTGDVVLQLDADDLADPTRVERVVAAYEAHPAAAWVFHRLRHVRRDTGEPVAGQPGLRRFAGGFHDFRADVRRGRLPVTMPATSGLSWRRDFLQALLPIPGSVRVHDNYLKFASLARGAGVFLDEVLGRQGMHAANFYAQKTGRDLRLTRARNAVSMLPGFRSLGPQLDGMWGRIYADAWVLSRGLRDFGDDEREELRRERSLSGVPARTLLWQVPLAAVRAVRG